MDIIEKGGVITWILIFYSIIGVTIVLSRWIDLLADRPLPSSGSLPQWPASRQKQILLAVQQAQSNGLEQTALRALSLRLIDGYMRRFERGLKTLSLLANTAPLLGLLGTIIGMISAFRVIESTGTQVDPQLLAGGIWEAMLTTGAGLAVALPLLIFLHTLESSIEKRHWRLYVRVSELIHEPIENQGI